MRQISQNYKTGSIRLENVSMPALKPGGVLVKTAYSVISIGTEGMKVREGQMSYLGMARSRPDQVKKVIQTIQQQGLRAAYEKVMNKLDSLTPLGYSAAGTVTAVGAGVNDLTVGQAVACAGAGYANHAEVNFVPRNLVVPVPKDVRMEHAAFSTIGAIAMQGFRQGEMRLGETACVIGLGLLGQILVQILNAAGVRVLGIDLSEERCELARKLGALNACRPDDPGLKSSVRQITRGVGCDAVFICAAGDSKQPAELAVELSRDRGRVIDIGKTHLDLPWKDYYEKEMEVKFSRSYGPGRYDPNYEERGVDYPIGYVRWTENRNMQAFLDLVASGRMQLDPIISNVYPFSEAESVFGQVGDGTIRGLGFVFKYDDAPAEKPASIPSAKPAKAGPVRLGVIGAGNYASSMLLPHLADNPSVEMRHVVTTTSLTAQNAARKFGFQNSGTDVSAVLNDTDTNAVLIATRHASHAKLTAQALRAGKAVFVEKPLAIDLAGVEEIRAAIVESGNERLQVGFNRRFSPVIRAMKEHIRGIKTPLVLNYRVHAGQTDAKSWYADASEGTRFAGEAGHFLDVFAFLTGARPFSVTASALSPDNASADDRENIIATVEYDNGSVASLLYLTQGSPKVPKECLEVFGGGMTMQMMNFESLHIFSGLKKKTVKGGMDKGQKNEMKAFVDAVETGGPMPISVECLLDTTLVTLAALDSVRRGEKIMLADCWQS